MPRHTPLAFALIALLLAAGCSAPSGSSKSADATAAASAATPPAGETDPTAMPASEMSMEQAAAAAVPAVNDSLAALAAPADSRLVTIEVGGMVCQACVVLVGKELRSVPGVYAASGDLPNQRFKVTCDPGVADSSLVSAVRRAGPHYLGMIAE